MVCAQDTRLPSVPRSNARAIGQDIAQSERPESRTRFNMRIEPATRLRAIRAGNPYAYYDLAEEIGIDKERIQAIANGDRPSEAERVILEAKLAEKKA